MEISINHQKKIIPGDYSLEQLLIELFPDSRNGLAVAVNQSIITKANWQYHKLLPQDNITLIKATQGG